MLTPLQLITKFYSKETDVRRILVQHSTQVAARALRISAAHPELCLDVDVLYFGGMLHDIGIGHCDAPGIGCYGQQPYLLHGPIGAQMLREEAVLLCDKGRESEATLLYRVARICERHTGTGLRRNDFKQLNLPIPDTDLLPQTLEEEVICYADKFYSKSHLERERTIEQTAASMERFGKHHREQFIQWAQRFEK